MIDKPVMIITGTRKGIGKYLAEYYVEKDFFIIGCSRSEIDFELNNYKHFVIIILFLALFMEVTLQRKG